MNDNPPSFGLWPLVILNTAIFVIFAFSFTRPRSRRDWRSFGAFSAFLAALFTEMYGFPLTVYLLSGWLGSRYPALGVLTHNNGHLWQALLGFTGNPHANPIHWLSDIAIGGGFLLIGGAWGFLYRAQQAHAIATTGPYSQMRHPQYLGFIIIMLGFLIQWPTIPTLIMFPILVAMYLRLAHREEKDALKEFGEDYARYRKATPGFWPRALSPRFSRKSEGAAG